MTEWSLPALLDSLHTKIQSELIVSQTSLQHPVAKGDATEQTWLDFFRDYLPERYCATKGQVVDSEGKFSQQIDIIIYDRQYSHFVFNFKGQLVLPAESVYAVFEAKQVLDAHNLTYAKLKAASVRGLHRTNAPIYSMGKRFEPASNPFPIIAGVLASRSVWKPPLGQPLLQALSVGTVDDHLDLGCVAADGRFGLIDGTYEVRPGGKPATAFLLDLMTRLQRLGTVPAIDFTAYARWLDEGD